MAEYSNPQSTDRYRTLPGRSDQVALEADPLLSEEPSLVRDDEREVYDLGFIIEDRTDMRACLLSRRQRSTDPEVREALENDPAGPLPQSVVALWQNSLRNDWRSLVVAAVNLAAEIDEAQFAARNGLVGDPDG